MRYTLFTDWEYTLLLAGDTDGLERVCFLKAAAADVVIPEDWVADSEFLEEAVVELREYFAGMRRRFEIKLKLRGSEFQQQVWHELSRIPYGLTRSYGEIAERIGRPGAARAVGLACGRNPLPVVIPCHRVIGANGKMTGFSSGLDIKRMLLGLEGVQVRG